MTNDRHIAAKTVSRLLTTSHQAVVEDLRTVLDIEAGLQEAMMPGRHNRFIAGLTVELDVDRGLDQIVSTHIEQLVDDRGTTDPLRSGPDAGLATAGSPVWSETNNAAGTGAVFGVQGGNIIFHDAGTPSHDAAELPPDDGRIRILILAANPTSTARLALDEEAREISEKLRLSRTRDRFEVITRWAERPADLLHYLNEFRPQVVHFSGHGNPAGEIVLSAGRGRGQPMTAAALGELFRVMRQDIRMVVLNACYSADQAQAIGARIDYVIGMQTGVDDGTATAFAGEFYSALGSGHTITNAYERALSAVMLHGQPGHDIPQLIVRQGANPHQTLTS